MCDYVYLHAKREGKSPLIHTPLRRRTSYRALTGPPALRDLGYRGMATPGPWLVDVRHDSETGRYWYSIAGDEGAGPHPGVTQEANAHLLENALPNLQRLKVLDEWFTYILANANSNAPGERELHDVFEEMRCLVREGIAESEAHGR